MDSNEKVIIWFRQDLRINDNQALSTAFNYAQDNQYKLVALYISTPQQWIEHDIAPIQIDFIERNLNQLGKSLAQLGIELKHAEVSSFTDQINFLTTFCNQQNVVKVFAGKEPEWNERIRDSALIENNFPIEFTEEHCAIPPNSVKNKQGKMFKVFTPFKKRWREIASTQHLKKIASLKTVGVEITFNEIKFNACKKDSSAWPAGEHSANIILKQFCEQKLEVYKAHRDFPALNNTSQLSPYLTIGVLSPKQCLRAIIHYYPAAVVDDTTAADTWLNELIWREFYRHLTVSFPKLSRNQNFKSNADKIEWRNNPKEFELWCKGETGYPLVDAAMRQLNQTGWMHNRLRMVTASFLSKHLLIDWRWGEKYFRQNLIDGDLAANNGGWQWSAGTGCDAQPYFRIFNPIEQSKKFDNTGSFIQHFIPELADVNSAKLHQANEIIESIENTDLYSISNKYAPAIVEHKAARERALVAMKVISQK